MSELASEIGRVAAAIKTAEGEEKKQLNKRLSRLRTGQQALAQEYGSYRERLQEEREWQEEIGIDPDLQLLVEAS